VFLQKEDLRVIVREGNVITEAEYGVIHGARNRGMQEASKKLEKARE
jgi:hypothetical protein